MIKQQQRRLFGVVIMQLALAIYLVVTGICLTFKIGKSISSSEIESLLKVFSSTSDIIGVVTGILLIVCGVIFLLKALNRRFDIGRFDDVLKYVTLFLWIAVTAVSLANNIDDWRRGPMILHWLLILAKNAFIIGGILTIKDGR